MIKVNELFAGIGAFRKALERLNIPHEIVGISEIDKYAIKSYEAIYGTTRNYGDISKVAKLDYADLWTYGFPCQDISQAGHQAGIIKGETRSGLLYEVERLLSVAAEHGELPKYLILENVKNLVGRKFIKQFEAWLAWLDECVTHLVSTEEHSILGRLESIERTRTLPLLKKRGQFSKKCGKIGWSMARLTRSLESSSERITSAMPTSRTSLLRRTTLSVKQETRKRCDSVILIPWWLMSFHPMTARKTAEKINFFIFRKAAERTFQKVENRLDKVRPG